MKYHLECCVGNLDDALYALDHPKVSRIELNRDLQSDGLTPSVRDLQYLKSRSNKPIVCMVRENPHHFQYSQQEKQQLFQQAKQLLEHHADGLVFGALIDQQLDLDFIEEMTLLCHQYQAKAIVHKAIDEVKDYHHSIEQLIQIKVDRLLTSGQQPNAQLGLPALRSIQQKYGKQIQILPCGGLRPHQYQTILDSLQTPYFHSACKKMLNGQVILDRSLLDQF